MSTASLRPVRAAVVERGLDPVHVRGIRPADDAELRRFYAGLSSESRRTRFLSVSLGLSQAQSTSFCTTDHRHREGFVAVLEHDDDPARIVGHLCLEPDGVDAAEVAIAVADRFQRRGVGRQLMTAATAWARRGRVARLTATMSGGNAPIQRLLVELGLPTDVQHVGAGVAQITIAMVGQDIAA
jgi:acetyltransferase